MRRNKFGEFENPHSTINIIITIIAVIAITVTGILYSMNLNSMSAETTSMQSSEDIS